MPRHTYIDACLLIAAFRGQGELGRRAMETLDDPDRRLIVSDAVWLELMPKAIYEKQQHELAFYEMVFEQAEWRKWDVGVLYQAHELAKQYGIAALDAIHVAFALACAADELISAEKPSKPMFRVQDILVRSIR